MRVGCDVGFCEAYAFHPAGNIVGGSFQTCVEAGDSVGLAHIQQVKRVDGGVLGQILDVESPVPGRTDQAVDEKQRASGASALVVNLTSVYLRIQILDTSVSLFIHFVFSFSVGVFGPRRGLRLHHSKPFNSLNRLLQKRE